MEMVDSKKVRPYTFVFLMPFHTYSILEHEEEVNEPDGLSGIPDADAAANSHEWQGEGRS